MFGFASPARTGGSSANPSLAVDRLLSIWPIAR